MQASLICDDGLIAFNPLGPGMDDFENLNNDPACLLRRETQSAWYRFRISANAPPATRLEFTLTPDGGVGEDYDFAIFGPNVRCDSLGSPIRCSYANNLCAACPETGLRRGYNDVSENGNGDGFLFPLNVRPGEEYYLMVDNWLGNSRGFVMEWGGTAKDYLSCCSLEALPGEDLSFCQKEEPITTRLNPSYSGDSTGTSIAWSGSYLNVPDSFSPSITIPSGFTGELIYNFHLTNADCTAEGRLEVFIHPKPAAILQAIDPICQGDGAILAQPEGSHPPFSFQWNTGDTLDHIRGLDNGVYQLTIADDNGCRAVAGLTLSGPPVLEITGFDALSPSCSENADGRIAVEVRGGSPPYRFSWQEGQMDSILSNLKTGSYQVIVRDNNGCTKEGTKSLAAPPPLSLAISKQDVSCFGYRDGQVWIEAARGGRPPYRLFFNDHTFSIDQQALSFPDLPAMNYAVRLLDANNCPWEETINVDQPPEFLLELTADTFPSLGDVVEMEVNANSPIASYQWSTTDYFLDDASIFPPRIQPLNTISYVLTITNEEGCRAIDEISIRVDPKRKVFIPNVFSPNGDGQNDRFTVFSNPGVQEIKSFKIFDRWGNLVFSRNNFQSNNPSLGWDGVFRGRKAATGVFFYLAEIEFIDGAVRIYKGDVLLTP